MERLAVSGERHRHEPVGMLVAEGHLGQQAVTVDLDLSLLHGCHHSLLNLQVAEAGDSGLWRGEDEVDTTSLHAHTEQRFHSGEHIDTIAIDDSVFWRDTKKQQVSIIFLLLLVIFSEIKVVTIVKQKH